MCIFCYFIFDIRSWEIASGCLSVTITVIHNLIILKASFNKIRKYIHSKIRLAHFVCSNDECFRQKTVDHENCESSWLECYFVIVRKSCNECRYINHFNPYTLLLLLSNNSFSFDENWIRAWKCDRHDWNINKISK